MGSAAVSAGSIPLPPPGSASPAGGARWSSVAGWLSRQPHQGAAAWQGNNKLRALLLEHSYHTWLGHGATLHRMGQLEDTNELSSLPAMPPLCARKARGEGSRRAAPQRCRGLLAACNCAAALVGRRRRQVLQRRAVRGLKQAGPAGCALLPSPASRGGGWKLRARRQGVGLAAASPQQTWGTLPPPVLDRL